MLELFTDHYFRPGFTHSGGGKPCQDYALSSVYQGSAFAIVADGCSSGGHTDVGARLVTFATASALRSHRMSGRSLTDAAIYDEIARRQQELVVSVRTTLDLGLCDLLSTCLWAYVSAEGGYAHVQGDGVVVFCFSDGAMTLSSFEWAGNVPFYPAYSGDFLESFRATHDAGASIPPLTEERWSYSKSHGFQSLGRVSHSLEAGMRGITIPISRKEVRDNLEKELTIIDSRTLEPYQKDHIMFICKKKQVL